ncbi:MAG: methyltransferase [Terracidiphilus sp.]|jgi:SAM-dependent methyltransferase
MRPKTYDQLWAVNWGDQQRYGPVHRRQREALVKLVAKLNPASVLDVGCGSGDNLAALAHAMPHLVLSGTDVSQEALALAARRVPGAVFKQLDAQKEKLDDKFDLVLCNQVVEHLADDMAAFCNLALMARRWVVVATMRGRMRPSELAIGHFRNYSDVELRAKAEHAGLEVVDIWGWGLPFYSPLYRTAIEWLSAGPPGGKFGFVQRSIASFLYHLYALNIPRRGDVVTMLARPRHSPL